MLLSINNSHVIFAKEQLHQVPRVKMIILVNQSCFLSNRMLLILLLFFFFVLFDKQHHELRAHQKAWQATLIVSKLTAHLFILY